MEMAKTNNFTEMSACEMQQVDGGLVPFFGVVIGIGIAIAGLVYAQHKYYTSRR